MIREYLVDTLGDGDTLYDIYELVDEADGSVEGFDVWAYSVKGFDMEHVNCGDPFHFPPSLVEILEYVRTS